MSYGGINSGAGTGVGSIIDAERDGKEENGAGGRGPCHGITHDLADKCQSLSHATTSLNKRRLSATLYGSTKLTSQSRCYGRTTSEDASSLPDSA